MITEVDKLKFNLIMVTMFDPILIQHMVSGGLLYTISFIITGVLAVLARGEVWAMLMVNDFRSKPLLIQTIHHANNKNI